MKKFGIAPEIREQIINRIKNEGISVAEASKDAGVSDASLTHDHVNDSADTPGEVFFRATDGALDS